MVYMRSFIIDGHHLGLKALARAYKHGRGHAMWTEGRMLMVTKFRIRFEWPGTTEVGHPHIAASL